MALKFKRAGTITKFVLLILGVYMAILLLSVRTQIRSAEADLRALPGPGGRADRGQRQSGRRHRKPK